MLLFIAMAWVVAIAPSAGALVGDPAIAQGEDPIEFDEEFPPGDPVINEVPGDNPVIGDNAAANETNYLRLALIATALIAAGFALIKAEGYVRSRMGQNEE